MSQVVRSHQTRVVFMSTDSYFDTLNTYLSYPVEIHEDDPKISDNNDGISLLGVLEDRCSVVFSHYHNLQV